MIPFLVNFVVINRLQYFVPLAVFIGIQWMYSTFALLDRESYIKDQLQLSWQAAYKDNVSILENIQNQWHCQGFSTILDDPAFNSFDENVDDACYPVLAETFGSTIFIWGIGLWVVKVIQVRRVIQQHVYIVTMGAVV